jgi:RimJ/RimL family protein N-acetyltransferase
MTPSRQRTPDGLSFTHVLPKDLPRLNELVNRPEIARYLNLIPPVPLQKTLDFADFARSRNTLWWCIRAEGRIVGSVGLIPEPVGTKLAHGATLFVYIEPACWGRGIGGRAVDHALQEARKNGFLRVECAVVEENAAAVALYEAHGFRREGRKVRAFLDEEGFHDLLMMGALLEEDAGGDPRGA